MRTSPPPKRPSRAVTRNKVNRTAVVWTLGGQGAWLARTVPLIAIAALAFYYLFPHIGYVNTLTASGGILRDSDKFSDVMIVPFIVVLQLGAIAWALRNEGNASSTKAGGDMRPALLAVVLYAVILALSGGARGLVLLLVPVGAALISYKASPARWQTNFAFSIVPSAVIGFAISHAVNLLPLLGFAASLALLPSLLAANPRIWRWVSLAASIGLIGILIFSMPSFHFPALTGRGSAVLNGGVLLLIAACAGAAFRQNISFRAGEKAAVPSALLIAVALIAITLSSPLGTFLPSDDYHFGERLLTAQAIQSGPRLFVDFFPPHGLMDGVGAFWQMLQGDQTPPAAMFGEWIMLAAVQLAAVSLFVWRLGAFLGTLLALICPDAISLLVLVLCMYGVATCGRSRYSFPAGALAAAGCMAMVFLTGGTGSAAAIAAYMAALVLQARLGAGACARFVLGSSLAASILGIGFHEEIRGQFFFLTTSAPANLTIYGNGALKGSSILPLAFAILPIVLFALIRADSRASGWPARKIWIAAWLAPIVIAVFLINSYAMSRLDSTAVRAIIAGQILIPFTLLWFALLRREFGDRLGVLTEAKIGLAGALVASVLAAYAPVPPMGLSAFAAPSDVKPYDPANGLPVISASVPRLGTGYSDPVHVRRIETVAAFVQKQLAEGETFLDLTNRNALYYYLNRSVPVPVSSAYNSAPVAFQKRFVEAALKARPPLALVALDNVKHDGLALPVRAHAIYKMLLREYRPFVSGKHVYAMRADRPLPQGEASAAAGSASSDADLWAAAFGGVLELGKLPSAWGRSMARLSDEIGEPTIGLQPSKPQDAASLQTQWSFKPDRSFSPWDTGLLAFDVSCATRGDSTKLRVLWRQEGEDFSDNRSVSFAVDYRRALAPLDASALWSLKSSVAEIRVDTIEPGACGPVGISNVRLLSRAKSE